MAGRLKRPENPDYWKNTEVGFPRKIKWKVIAGPDNLHSLQMYDLIFDEFDLKLRKIHENRAQ